jgi:hypothetical protein
VDQGEHRQFEEHAILLESSVADTRLARLSRHMLEQLKVRDK